MLDIGELKIPCFQENEKVFVFTHMTECLKIIENLRGNITHLSTLTTKPYKTAFGENAIQM